MTLLGADLQPRAGWQERRHLEHTVAEELDRDVDSQMGGDDLQVDVAVHVGEGATQRPVLFNHPRDSGGIIQAFAETVDTDRKPLVHQVPNRGDYVRQRLAGNKPPGTPIAVPAQ